MKCSRRATRISLRCREEQWRILSGAGESGGEAPAVSERVAGTRASIAIHRHSLCSVAGWGVRFYRPLGRPADRTMALHRPSSSPTEAVGTRR